MKRTKQAANRWAVSLAVSGTMILSLTFGILPIHAAAEERTFYESDYVAEGAGADYYNERMDELLGTFIDYFTETGELDKLKGYDEPVSFTVVGAYDGSTIDALDYLNELYGETLEQNRFSDLYKRLYNVEYTYNWQSLQSDYESKLNLDITAGEIPDIFVVESQTDLISLAEQGLIWDMTDWIDNDTVELLREDCWNADGGLALKMGSYEGRNYGLPIPVSSTDDVLYLWLRADWLEKLGLEVPKTLDELEQVMEAFVTQDPDGNGEDDTWGINVAGNLPEYTTRGVMNAYGAYPYFWIEKENGEVVYGTNQEETKEAIKRVAQWYEKGYINPESITQDLYTAYEDVIREKCGILYAPAWLGNNLTSMFIENPDAKWGCYHLPSLNEGEAVKCVIAPNVNRGFVVVNSEFEHPEIALKMMATSYFLLAGDNYGRWWNQCNGEHGEIGTNTTWYLNPIRFPESATSNVDTYNNLLEFKEAGYDESVLKGQAASLWSLLQKTGEEYDYADHMMWDPDNETASCAVLKDVFESGNTFYSAFNGPANELMQQNWSALMDAAQQLFNQSIYGQDADAAFEQWLATWDSLGGEEITAYANEWHQANS